MWKRYVLAGVVMLLASAVSYELVQTASAPPVPDPFDGANAGARIEVTTLPLVTVAAPARVADMIGTLHSLSDITVLMAAGTALLVAAAGVRRHTS